MYWGMRFTAGNLRSGCAFFPGPRPADPGVLSRQDPQFNGSPAALLADTSACRLVFGEGDLLPGIIIDRYGKYIVLQTLTRGAEALKFFLVDAQGGSSACRHPGAE